MRKNKNEEMENEMGDDYEEDYISSHDQPSSSHNNCRIKFISSYFYPTTTDDHEMVDDETDGKMTSCGRCDGCLLDDDDNKKRRGRRMRRDDDGIENIIDFTNNLPSHNQPSHDLPSHDLPSHDNQPLSHDQPSSHNQSSKKKKNNKKRRWDEINSFFK